MKKLLLLLLAMAIGVPGFAAEKIHPESICPKTKISQQSQCLTCHTWPSFKLKQNDSREGLIYPNWITFTPQNKPIGYLLIEHVSSDTVNSFYEYIDNMAIKNATVEIFSPGGSMMQAWRIIAIMEQYKHIHTTTIVRGFAASAGLIIFCAGEQRLVHPRALLMWHEISQFKMFDVSSPSDKEDEARVLRLFQSNLNDWLSKKSKLTKEEIDQKIRKREFWFTGKQAVEFGFATGYIK